MFIMDLSVAKVVFLYFIFCICIIYQILLIITMYKKRHEIDILSAVKRDNRISKAGLFFMVLMLIITYQSLFLDEITTGLVELMLIVISGDLGAKAIDNYTKIKKLQTNINEETNQ